MISLKHLTDFGIHATDGDIGRCKDILFDDQDFVTRYFVADTHRWLPLGRKVVISPIALQSINRDDSSLVVNMSKQALKDSPSIDEHKPVSREYEETLFKYFGYGYYWVGPGAWGDFSHPTELVDQQHIKDDIEASKSQPVNHLRSCDEILGYDISAGGDNTGHVYDFIVDTKNWSVKLIIIDTRNWLPGGKKVAITPDMISDIDWSSHKVHTHLQHNELLALPEIDDNKLDDSHYLSSLFDNNK
ncbi:PRC-barrel domain containing protein [Aestuariibacter sp. A3R04]|uniref:PRC-barrel domain containing protein n=1 Tax=Aestuariibacter sp. A3R04 TaxID=2841571 RepID=UPI001C093F61|nr:PRC-barrel domain containing protein [Aestuariibacter sp. A3R04]MBU3023215.1 PRC-barrel domain containing protein [Aestuariibacter sp. A3R04]